MRPEGMLGKFKSAAIVKWNHWLSSTSGSAAAKN